MEILLHRDNPAIMGVCNQRSLVETLNSLEDGKRISLTSPIKSKLQLGLTYEMEKPQHLDVDTIDISRSRGQYRVKYGGTREVISRGKWEGYDEGDNVGVRLLNSEDKEILYISR